MLKIFDGRDSFYQWDINQRLTSPTLAEGDEVHLYNMTLPRALVVQAYEFEGVIVADVPNILLQSALNIKVFRYVTNGDSRHTREECSFPVIARAMPEDYVYTETDVLNYKFLTERLQYLEEYGVSKAKLDQAVVKYFDENPITIEESDPTVPEWAKAKEKPTYTAKEVGAIPEDTPIPPIKYVESLDESSLETLISIRSLDSGTYILHGKFVPFSGSDEVIKFSSGMLASILKQNVISYMQVFYPVDNTVQYFEITDNECVRSNNDLANMESIENKITSMDKKSTDIQYPTAKAVFDALNKKEDVANKVDEITKDATDDQYPTAKAAKTELDKKEDVKNKVKVIDELSSNDKYPSAKAVYNWGKDHESVNNKVTAITDKSEHTQYPTAKAVYDIVKNNTQSVSDGSVPRMSTLNDDLAEEQLGNTYNRLYCERSKKDLDGDGIPDERGTYARMCVTENPTPPPDPDIYAADADPSLLAAYLDKRYGTNVSLNSIPQRTKHGDLRIPARTIDEAEKLDPTYSKEYPLSIYAAKKLFDTKVDKIDSKNYYQVYVDLNGVVTPLRARTTPLTNTAYIPIVDGNGILQCNTPDTASDDSCANKGYVDKSFGNATTIEDVTSLPEKPDDKNLYRLFAATFIHNRHVVDNSICYCVNTLPEVGEPATDGKGSVRAYYNMSNGKVYGYLNNTLGSMFGVPAGWYDAGMLLNAQGWAYSGVISDLNNDPKDSCIRVLLQYTVHHYKDGKWMLISDFDVTKWLYPAMIKEQGYWIYSYNNLDLKNPKPDVIFSSWQLNDEHEWQIPERKNGIMKCATPIEDDDCSNKDYVDNRFNGANKAVSYADYPKMLAELYKLSSNEFHVGQNIMIVQLDVPDLWVSNVSTTFSNYTYTTDAAFIEGLKSKGGVKIGYYTLSLLETQKVDLTNYPTAAQIQALNTELNKKLNDGTPQYRNNNFVYTSGMWIFAVRIGTDVYQSLGVHYIFSDSDTHINGRNKGGTHFSIVIGKDGKKSVYNTDKKQLWDSEVDGIFEIYATRLDNQ